MHNNEITQAQVLAFLLFLASAILLRKLLHSFRHLISIMASYDKLNSMARESKITHFVHRNHLICLPSFQTHPSHFINSAFVNETQVPTVPPYIIRNKICILWKSQGSEELIMLTEWFSKFGDFQNLIFQCLYTENTPNCSF